MNESMEKWMNRKWMGEWKKKFMNKKMNKWLSEWMIEWMHGYTNQRFKWIDDLSFSNQIENVNLNESQLAWCDESASRARHQQKQRARQ